MIKAIDKKYCVGDMVQLMPLSDYFQLIMDANEVVLLKVGNNVLINKYINHPNRNLFPYHERESYNGKYCELFEYNKLYLNFRGSVSGFDFSGYYFFRGTDRALCVNDRLTIDERSAKKDKRLLTRKELENFFNSKNYDSMYVVYKNGSILYADNKIDGRIVDGKMIPSDNEIIDMELNERDAKKKIALNSMGRYDEANAIVEKAKSISEIKEFNLYGSLSMFSDCSHFLITSKDGKFVVKMFAIDFVGKDQFRLTTIDVPIIIPTIDDVINYSRNNQIGYTEDPVIETDMREVISRISLDDSTKIKIKKYLF